MGLGKGMRALPLMLWCIAGGVPSLVQPGKMVLISMNKYKKIIIHASQAKLIGVIIRVEMFATSKQLLERS